MVVAGCVSQPSHPPIEDASDASRSTRTEGVAPIERTQPSKPVDAPATTTDSRVQPSAATTALLASVDTAVDEQDHTTAIVLLERAIRLSPREPTLWIRLSESHLHTGNTTAAEQHVRKAIALATNDPTLTRRAWLQLARVLDAQGKTGDAASIRRRYGPMRG
jgi:Flp pilus assembly protein TadD